jgi:hypothetical protein
VFSGDEQPALRLGWFWEMQKRASRCGRRGNTPVSVHMANTTILRVGLTIAL